MKNMLRNILIKKNIFISRMPLDDITTWSDSERQVEYFWVLRNLKLEKGYVLDVGCNYTQFPVLLDKQGIKVIGCGLEDYHSDEIDFIREDAKHLKLTEKFDRILLISTLEHITHAKETVYNLKKMLKPEGRFLVTLPYHKDAGITPLYKLYNNNDLEQLFEVEKQDFFKRKDRSWRKCDKNYADTHCNELGDIITCIIGR